MPEQAYNYSITADLPGGEVNASTLAKEILASPIVTAIERITTEGSVVVSDGTVQGGTLSIVFKAALSSGDKTLLDGDEDGPAGGLLAAHDNTPKDSSAIRPVEIITSPATPPTFSNAGNPISEQALFATHNFCDQRTWWQKSIRLTALATTRGDAGGGSGRVYNPATAITDTIINANEGLINQEDCEPAVIACKFRVYVDGVEKVVAGVYEDIYPTTTNWASYGADCEVDFATGAIKFKTDPGVNAVVTFDCSTHNPALPAWLRSMYTIMAPTHKKLKVMGAETQFTNGVPLKDSTIFSGFAPLSYDGIQADATLDPGTNPKTGTRYRIDNAAALHANFGTIWLTADGRIVTLGNGDIVEFETSRKWGILFDASANASALAIHLTNGVPVAFGSWNGSVWSAAAPGVPTICEVWGHRKVYKTLQDFLNEATGNSAPLPAEFVAGPGGTPYGITQIPWNWIGTKLLESATSAMIVIWLKNGIPHGTGDGTHFITGTIYCRILDENGG